MNIINTNIITKYYAAEDDMTVVGGGDEKR